MPSRWSRKKGNRKRGPEEPKEPKEPVFSNLPEDLEVPLSSDVNENRKVLEDLFSDCYDVIIRSFHIGNQIQAVLIYIKSLTNTEEVNDNVLNPLMTKNISSLPEFEQAVEILPVASTEKLMTVADCVEHLSNGETVVLIDGMTQAVGVGMTNRKTRGILEPDAEPAIRGAKDGFIESVDTNVSLLRSRIRSPRLKLEKLTLGRYTNTPVVIAYIEGVVDPGVLEEVRRRLGRIDIDGILESGYIEELIEDHPLSPFPQVQMTERVDITAASLLEGRVAILTDGTPSVLVVPLTLPTLLQAAEDYYTRSIASTAFRWLRYFLYFVSLTLPAFYVATITFHPEAVPTDQLVSFAGARERIPIPALVEALVMETAFEALREAGLRLPKVVGPAVSIVGALVIGEAAVSAGLISAPKVIVVAVTAIASFAIPRYYAGLSFRLLRFPLLILGGTLGILGLIMGLIAIVVHLSTLRSFGVPYLSPLAPLHAGDLKDVLARVPQWMMDKRPAMLNTPNKRRQSDNLKPGLEQQGEDT
jgi:hypothetical protein